MSVVDLDGCRIRVMADAWPFAAEHDAAIAVHWQRATDANPKLFNGDVFMVADWALDGRWLTGQVHRTTFAAYLYWRSNGFNDGRYDEAFATTVVLARDGGMLVARAVDGSLNEGHFVSPGGMIDARDVTPDGLLDPAGAAMRELEEETGLAAPLVRRRAGMLLARYAPYLPLASVFDADCDSAALAARVERHIAAQATPELLDVRVLSGRGELDQLVLTTATRLLGEHLLA